MKKKWNKIVEEILKMDSDMSKLSDSELRHKTDEFKLRLKEGTSLDSLLPEAFAVVRETAFRVVGMKPYPVQIMGGIAIHEGNIAEMATGEGKTLVSIYASTHDTFSSWYNRMGKPSRTCNLRS